MLILLAAAGSMAFKDACGTLLVIAEARGRALMAGALDALGDLALILTTILGAGQVILHGWSAHSLAVLAVLMATSFLGTLFWVRVGRAIKAAP